MYQKSLYTRMADVLVPLLFYLAVTTVISYLLRSEDISLGVLVGNGLCIPLLAWWYCRDRSITAGRYAVRPTENDSSSEGIHIEGTAAEGLQTEELRSERTQAGRTRSEGKQTEEARAEKRPVLQWILSCVICLAGGAALSALSSFLMDAMGVYSRFSNAAQEAYAASPAVLLLLGPGLAAPVCEELVYRGLLYRRLKNNTIPTALAALLSAAAFAIGHGNVIQFLYAFPMGLILCAAAELYGGNVILPIMIHLGANLFSAVMSLVH